MGSPFGRRSKTQEDLDKIKIEKLQFDLLQKKQDLVRAADLEDIWIRAVISCRTKLLEIPTVLAPQLITMETPEEIEAALREEISQALNEMATAAISDLSEKLNLLDSESLQNGEKDGKTRDRAEAEKTSEEEGRGNG